MSATIATGGLGVTESTNIGQQTCAQSNQFQGNTIRQLGHVLPSLALLLLLLRAAGAHGCCSPCPSAPGAAPGDLGATITPHRCYLELARKVVCGEIESEITQVHEQVEVSDVPVTAGIVLASGDAAVLVLAKRVKLLVVDLLR